jgi:hypothetical protein
MWETLAEIVSKKFVYWCVLRAQRHSLLSTDPEFKTDGRNAEAMVQHWYDVAFSGAKVNK